MDVRRVYQLDSSILLVANIPIHIVTCSMEELTHRYCDGGQIIENVVEDGYDMEKPFALVDFVNVIDWENQ